MPRTVTLLVLLWVCFAAPTALAEAVEPASRSLAIIFSRGIDGTSCGNGFVVGDGTLLVTARQVVFPRRPSGMHQGDAFVTVLSPFLGEAAEAQVVAQDRELELVLLRVPWRGHPALQLAAESDLLAAEKLRVLAFPNEQSAVSAGHPALLVSVPQAKSAALDVNAVMVRRNATRAITTSTAPPGPGWAGAPMLLQDGHTAAGCYLRTQADGSAGAGTACGAIQRLIEAAGASDSLKPADPRPPERDAAEASLAYLRGISASAAGDSDASLRHLQSFLKQRLDSAIGYRDAAGQLRALGRLQESQDHYAKALQLEPSLISARVLYGQLLDERTMPRAAEEHLLYAWQHGGPGGTAAVLPLCNLLRQQGRERECIPLLDAALQRRSNDGHLWNYLGHCKRALEDHSGAAAAFTRAADLMPDDPLSRLKAAEQFEAAGLRDRAEEQYRALLAATPDSATAHFHFARFISRESGRRAEAIKHAEEALARANEPGAPPRAVIESLLAAIRAGKTSPGSELRL